MIVQRRTFLGCLASVPFLRLGPTPVSATAALKGLVWSGWSQQYNAAVWFGYWHWWEHGPWGLRAMVNPVAVPDYAARSSTGFLDQVKAEAYQESLTMIETPTTPLGKEYERRKLAHRERGRAGVHPTGQRIDRAAFFARRRPDP